MSDRCQSARCFAVLIRRWTNLLRQIALPGTFPGLKAYLYRWLIALPGLPLLATLHFIHGVFLFLDEILFRNYRNTNLEKPVFILGVPRSGTTHIHHLLAKDQQFTTVTLWEALFAPSITQRYLFRLASHLDKRLGSPVGHLLKTTEQRLQKSLSTVHETGLHCPEEDFLLLLPMLDCFLLVLVFPESRWLWTLACGDHESNKQQSARMMKRYRRLLQRHVYFHRTIQTQGNARSLEYTQSNQPRIRNTRKNTSTFPRLLSKNASFAGVAHALVNEFPDCHIVLCQRDAPMAVLSQLRSVAEIRRLMRIDEVYPEFENKLLDTLHFYYKNLQKLQEILPPRQLACVALKQLSRQPRQTIESVYAQLKLNMGNDKGNENAGKKGHRKNSYIDAEIPLDPALQEALYQLEQAEPVQPQTRMKTLMFETKKSSVPTAKSTLQQSQATDPTQDASAEMLANMASVSLDASSNQLALQRFSHWRHLPEERL